MTTLPDKLIYPKPFAGGAGAVITPFSDAVDGDKVNFETGFPDAYSAPKSNGGKFVTRGEMNYLGNIATKNDYYRMCGGINTFDPVFASKIGGYPKDAILDYFDGVNLFKVISLVEDNMHDFRGGGFGDKWVKLGTNEIISGRYLLASYKDFNVLYSGYEFVSVGNFDIPKDGIINIEVTSYSAEYESGGSLCLRGTAFLGRSFSSDEDLLFPTISPASNPSFRTVNYNNYNIIGGLSTDQQISATSGSSGSYVYPGNDIVRCKTGDVFRLAIQNGLKFSGNGGDNLIISFNVYVQ